MLRETAMARAKASRVNGKPWGILILESVIGDILRAKKVHQMAQCRGIENIANAKHLE